MIIEINRDWRIESDPLQWIVRHRRAVNGTDRWDGKTFHKNLDSAIVWLASEQIMPAEGVRDSAGLALLQRDLDRFVAEAATVMAEAASDAAVVTFHVGADWRIHGDTNQWIVQRRRFVKGEDKWDGVSYHRSVQDAVMALAQRRMRDLEGVYRAEALAPICQATDKIKRDIESVVGADRRIALEGARRA